MPPANTSFATAVTIGVFPYDVTQTDINDAGVNFTVYYRFIAPASAVVIGAWGFSTRIGAGYRPTLFPYDGPAGAPVSVLSIAAQNKPIQFPVVPGQEYFLEFVKNANSAGPESLRVRVELAPDADALTGAIMVNDDTNGFPFALLSSTVDHTALKFVKNITAGEGGDILNNRITMWEDGTAFPQTVKIYDANLIQTGLLTPDGAGGELRLRTCTATQRIWVARNINPVTVQRITAAGAFVAGTFTLTGNGSIIAIAANNVETILYFAETPAGSAIERWDLVLNVAMSNLVAGIANYRVMDIFYLSDDTIIVLYYNSATKDVQAKRYSTAGATLNTYALGAQTGLTIPRGAYALDNPNSFWVWTHSSSATGGISTFRNVRCSDGVILTTRAHTEYEGGAMVGVETATPTGRFGSSFSCPFFILTSSAGYPGIYILVPDKTDDTVNNAGVELDLAIPDPTFRTGLLG